MGRMRDLYYDRDRPMIEVADAFGVPVPTFPRWIAEMGWPRRTSLGRTRDYAQRRETASPTPVPSPRGGRGRAAEPAKAGPNIHDEAFAIEVAVAARRELRALADLSGPVDTNLTLGERAARRADREPVAVDRAARPRLRTAHAAEGAETTYQTSRGRTGGRAQHRCRCDGGGQRQTDAVVPVRRGGGQSDAEAAGEEDAPDAARI